MRVTIRCPFSPCGRRWREAPDAPTFFPLHRIAGELFADGGLYANSPDHLALHEAEHFLEQNLEHISILSIGTTTAKFSFSNTGETNLGWMGWMDNQRLPRVMIAAQQLEVEAFHRTFDHAFGGEDLGLPDRRGCFNINDDRVLDVDQVIR
jgi:hypothetical protein